MVIRYHAWWPSTADPYYQFNTTENAARINYYPPHTDGQRYTPYLWIDGDVRGAYGTNIWDSLITSELAVSSPMEIEIGGTFQSSLRSGTLQITVIATAPITNTNLRLRLGLTESDIHWTAPNHSTVHNQTFRDMIPNTTGISLSINQGDTLHFSQPFTCSASLVQANCDIVAFVQSDDNRRILQATKIDLMSINSELTAFSLVGPPNGDTIYTCSPNFIWHASSDPDSGYPITYSVYVSHSLAFADTLVLAGGSDTTLACPVCLPYDTISYWKVLASNGHAPNRFSTNVYSFIPVHPCSYISGDINGDGLVRGADVTYGVRFFKGLSAPPPDSCYHDSIPNNHYLYVAGDVNGDCQFRGSDVTRLVGYFKGLSILSSCPWIDPPGPLLILKRK